MSRCVKKLLLNGSSFYWEAMMFNIKRFLIITVLLILNLISCATKTTVKPAAEYIKYGQHKVDADERLTDRSYSLAGNDKKRILRLVTINDDTLDFGDVGAVIYAREGFVMGATTENKIVKIPFDDIKYVKTRKIDILKSLAYLGLYFGIAYLVFDGITGDSFDIFRSCGEAGY